ncbi:MAG: DUF1223 domain-containing protein [Mucilaginibacter sp.]|uniref:DUF1223 domain-containing protein n=1 Tax=Mucilaginibacter sp. TaxID=1882438 RepID=UPI0034E5AB59
MKAIKLFILAGCLATVGIISWIVSGGQPKPSLKNIAVKGFVVIELFTSQGCSSCPPADELVKKIQKESNNLPVYILAFHVDYWNRLGWKDVFSSAAYSKRQNQYADWLNLQSIYTPQIVVNGRKEFIGSEEGTLRNAIKSSLQKPSPTTLTLDDVKFDKDQINLQYKIEGTTNNASLVLALVQKSATTNVKGGENGGRTLAHVQIVRNLQTLNLGGKNNGSATIAIPSTLNNQSLEVIAFLQNNSNGQILAAAKSGLNNSVALVSAKNTKPSK